MFIMGDVMTKLKIVNLILLVVTLIFEIFGRGAVLYFGNPEGEDWYRTYSYFSLTPFGYANFGPFITALITCALLIIIVITLFKDGKKLNTTIFVLGCIAAVASLSPLLYGFRYFNIVSLVISVLLIAFVGIRFYVIRRQ